MTPASEWMRAHSCPLLSISAVPRLSRATSTAETSFVTKENQQSRVAQFGAQLGSSEAGKGLKRTMHPAKSESSNNTLSTFETNVLLADMALVLATINNAAIDDFTNPIICSFSLLKLDPAMVSFGLKGTWRIRSSFL